MDYTIPCSASRHGLNEPPKHGLVHVHHIGNTWGMSCVLLGWSLAGARGKIRCKVGIALSLHC